MVHICNFESSVMFLQKGNICSKRVVGGGTNYQFQSLIGLLGNGGSQYVALRKGTLWYIYKRWEMFSACVPEYTRHKYEMIMSQGAMYGDFWKV